MKRILPIKHLRQISINFVIAGLCLVAQTAMSQSWTNLGSGLTGDGMADPVRSLTVSTNGELYAGGAFTNTGSLSVNYIAKWNGSSWTNLDSGMNGLVISLAVTNGELYAGGTFTSAGGVGANEIAKWNGSTWTNLGNGMNDRVSALALDTNGELYAGGYFTTAGGISANHIAKWNGSSWTNLGSGVGPAYVYALAIGTNGELYAGGTFTSAGGVGTNRIAKWNGSTWTNLGSGMNNDVNALAIGANGELYAGGYFTNAGGVGANRIAKWNGSTWTNLGNGMNGTVHALSVGADGELYAGGAFTNAGDVGANRIAKWNGSTWTNLGNGINSTVRALAVGRYGELYAGGNFTNAGGASAANIAKWSVPNMNVLGTNGAIIANNESATAGKGTDFGARSVGASFTNVFSVANNGSESLQITGVTTSGTGAAYFSVNGMPGTVGAGGGVSNFTVIFSPIVAGVHTAVVAIVNNSTNTPYRVNFRGQSSGQISLSTTSLTFTGTYNGSNPESQDLEISNLSLVSLNYANVIQYGSGADGWLSIFPASGSIAGSGYQATLASVDIAGLNAGVYTGTNAVTSTNAWNSPQNLVVTLTINRAGQTITFPAIADQLVTNTVGLSASALSGLPVSFNVAGGSAQITGGTNLSFTGTGTVSIVASQAGDSNWNAAPGVTNSFTVHATPPAPQNVSATDGSYIDKVTVTWSAASVASGYQVWRNTANISSSATQIGTVSQTNYDDASATVGVLYYYWVKATNIYGASAFTASDTGWRADISAGVCADYDGDGKADPAVYDEATGTWKARLSSANYYLVDTTLNGLGGVGLASVSADYDGDGKADPAVYQELTGRWIILPSSASYSVAIVLSQTLGGIGYSGMPADYDGDRLADPGVYQREQGDWKVLLSSANYSIIELPRLLGGPGYRAVAADYDGDGKADPAIYGESSGYWIFKLSSIGYLEIALTQTLGGTGYVPVPADYDGDRLADPAVYHQGTGYWYIMYSSLHYDIVIKTWTF